MVRLVIWLSVIILALLATAGVGAAEPGQKINVYAYCRGMPSLKALREVLIEAERLDFTVGTVAGDKFYRDFILDDEFKCWDTRLQDDMIHPLYATRMASVLEPAARRGCREIVFWEVMVFWDTFDRDLGRTLYTWSLNEEDC